METMRSMEKHFLIFCFLLALSLAILKPTEGLGLKRWHIHIVNGLSKDQNLFVHCQSKDDDLGKINLSFGREFNWSFKVNFWDTTLFWCYLQKPNAESVSFEAFWVEKKSIWLFYRCYDTNCIWTAKDDGIYLKNNPINKDVLVHKWRLCVKK
ncbi:hypothetical protein IC582_000632 [Cucumis melo]